MSGQIKKLFPGGNTSQGFFSYFHYVIDCNATKIISLKGGPGVGKSNFMRRIGEEMLALGYDLEYHFCSSDSDSIDAVVIPALGVALFDGTPPHIIEPPLPGAVGQIINLGRYWDQELLRTQKGAIANSTTKIGRCFKMAYCRLKEARVIKEEIDLYYHWAADLAPVNDIIHQIIQSSINSPAIQFKRLPKTRHLFSSAFTPQGHVHHLPSLLQDVEKLHLFTGKAGAMGGYVVSTIAKAVHLHGLASEVYHCPLIPEDVDLVVIPTLKVAVLKEIPGLNFTPQHGGGIKEIKKYHLEQYLCAETLRQYREQIRDGEQRLRAAIEQALKHIAAAKAEHDVLEGYYIPAMDFDAVNERRRQVLEQILDTQRNI